ncbi:ABC-type dipeptide/oligopeptide/nickel transport system permease component [Tumebacillus sp. BK434]|uniref:ABC transporter permease subunit n=1 Tax=Tumebacillus sp. BK434 TaxID=2512169 RepID=UPI0010432E09|nr:ABC transporter permease subunit [Tumebacillus sp. BK434]TCP57657.1 ABC-type dipeptide/oligopeptide/nickel transport system permease component [Tumebacillus sp. BK434]
MVRILQGLLVAVGILAGILLISNLDKGIDVISKTEIQVVLLPGGQLEHVVEAFPGTKITDAAAGYIAVPAGKKEVLERQIARHREVQLTLPVVTAPSFDLARYTKALQEQMKSYLDGDFGKIGFMSRPQPIPVTDSLPEMLKRSMSYLVPGLFLGITLGFLAALLAVWKPKAGKVLDTGQSFLMSLPDFFVVVLLQFLAIAINKLAGSPVIIIMQFVKQTPLLIPMLAISILPAALIYGTLRIAFEREWEEGYIKTAYAKGLSRPSVIFVHMMRNTMEDFLTIIPRAVSMALTSLVVVEVMTGIFGLGGYAVNQNIAYVTSLATTCAILAGFSLLVQGLFAILRSRVVVTTKEGA